MSTRPHDAFLLATALFFVAGATEVFNTWNLKDAEERCWNEQVLKGTPKYNKDKEATLCNRYTELRGNQSVTF